MQETRERNKFRTSLQNVKPEKLTDVNEALSVNASAAGQGYVNSVVVIDELDKIDSAIDIDAAESGDLYFDYSQLK